MNLKVLLPFQSFRRENRIVIAAMSPRRAKAPFGLLPHRLDCGWRRSCQGILNLIRPNPAAEVLVAVDEGVLVKTGMDVRSFPCVGRSAERASANCTRRWKKGVSDALDENEQSVLLGHCSGKNWKPGFWQSLRELAT